MMVARMLDGWMAGCLEKVGTFAFHNIAASLYYFSDQTHLAAFPLHTYGRIFS